MNKSECIVYFLNKENIAMSEKFDELQPALLFSESQRKAGFRHVTMSVENSSQVGKMGVDQVVDGKTPDGIDYTWVKRRPPTTTSN